MLKIRLYKQNISIDEKWVLLEQVKKSKNILLFNEVFVDKLAISQKVHNIRLLKHKPAVYLNYDRKGNLVYIGQSLDCKRRSYEHAANYKIPVIESVECIYLDQYIDMLLVEIYLINKLKPSLNKQFTYWKKQGSRQLRTKMLFKYF